jgi:epoxyqueuosine reductase
VASAKSLKNKRVPRDVNAVAPAHVIAALAKESGFDLVGFARPEKIPGDFLTEWIEQGYHADLDWMAQRIEERLDVKRLMPSVKTVAALACNYFQNDEPSPVARYARGRDYHHTMRDRLRNFRRALRVEFGMPIAEYTSVDAAPVLEKVWASRAGLGYVGKNGCFITPEYGSWVVLSTMFLPFEVDAYAAGPTSDVCGRCRICIDACPTAAIVDERVVDAGKCLSFQTIENESAIPVPLRDAMPNLVFGCDICEEVCPLNATPVIGGSRFIPRAIASFTARDIAALTKEQYDTLIPGTPLARAGHLNLKRNAAYALGAAKDVGAKPILNSLLNDSDGRIQEAARWALSRLED